MLSSTPEFPYEICSFVDKKGNRKSVFGNLPPTSRIDLNGTYKIFVPNEFYSELRGLTEGNGESTILNSNRKILSEVIVKPNGNMTSYLVDGREYAHLVSWGERSAKKDKVPEPVKSSLDTGEPRYELSDNAKRKLREIRSKRYDEQIDITKLSRSEILEKLGIAREIGSGCCVLKGEKTRYLSKIRDAILYHVIEGAKKLDQRPGKVMPKKDGRIEMDRTAITQFRTAYPTV